MDATPATDNWAASLLFVTMDTHTALTIADTWKYPPPYDFYDATADPEDYAEFITPSAWPELFWQVRHDDQLVGFFTADSSDDDSTCEISLGLRPDLTGGGRGVAFLRRGLDLVVEQMQPQSITLTVAAFNERAIKVYEAVGFHTTRQFLQPTNGSAFDFVEMALTTSSTNIP